MHQMIIINIISNLFAHAQVSESSVLTVKVIYLQKKLLNAFLASTFLDSSSFLSSESSLPSFFSSSESVFLDSFLVVFLTGELAPFFSFSELLSSSFLLFFFVFFSFFSFLTFFSIFFVSSSFSSSLSSLLSDVTSTLGFFAAGLRTLFLLSSSLSCFSVFFFPTSLGDLSSVFYDI